MPLKYLKNVSTLELDVNKCNGCGTCQTVCPHGALEMRNKRASIADLDACMECGACAKNCSQEAIAVQAGVGCAAALIDQALNRNSACCSGGSSC